MANVERASHAHLVLPESSASALQPRADHEPSNDSLRERERGEEGARARGRERAFQRDLTLQNEPSGFFLPPLPVRVFYIIDVSGKEGDKKKKRQRGRATELLTLDRSSTS